MVFYSMQKNDCYCTWTFEYFERFELFKVNIDKDYYYFNEDDDNDEHIAIDIDVIEKKKYIIHLLSLK